MKAARDAAKKALEAKLWDWEETSRKLETGTGVHGVTPVAPGPRTASILAVGSELLGTTRLDTNSLFLTGRMEALGIATVRKACVGDDWNDLVAEIAAALERAPLLVTSGGLGPTDDDRTKEAVAKVLGRSLVRDEEILLRLKERFRKRGYEMPEVNAKQADVIEGATVLANRRGSAPGFLVEQGGKTVVLLPGVPHEMKAMWDDAVAPLLARTASARAPPAHPEGGRDAGERRRDARSSPSTRRIRTCRITILAAPGEVQLHFAARGTPEQAARRSSTGSRPTSTRRSPARSSAATTRRSKARSATSCA